MQMPGFTICYVRIQSAQDAGRVATGFPLPSTGRGIEGEGWSYPEPPPARASGGGRSRAATPFACGAGTLWRCPAHRARMFSSPRLVRGGVEDRPQRASCQPPSEVCSFVSICVHLRLKTPEISLFTFLHFETAPHNDPTHRRQPMGGRARHSVRAAIDIQVSKPSQLSLTHCCFTFKKLIMQVTICKSVTLAAKAPKLPGHVATGFPLPSTGRGIEGEGWSYPELPPVRFFLYQHHPASKLNT